MLHSIIQFAETHKGMDITLSAWVTRETPLIWGWVKNSAWPRLVAIYPYARDNGGVGGIIRNFLIGKPKQQTQNIAT